MSKNEVRSAKAFSPVVSLDLSKLAPALGAAKNVGNVANGGAQMAGRLAVGAGDMAARGFSFAVGSEIGQKVAKSDFWSLFPLLVASGLIHAADYWFFGFTNSPARVLLYLLFAILYGGILYSDKPDERMQTLKAMLWTSFFMVLISGALVRYATSIPAYLGSVEFLAGIILFTISFSRPGLFVRGPVLNDVFHCFIFSAFIAPYLAQGIADHLLASVPTFQYIVKNYLSALFWPVWLYNLLFSSRCKSNVLRFISVVIILLLLSPIWIDLYRSGKLVSESGGINAEQTETYLRYLAQVRDAGILVAKSSRNFYNESANGIVCGYYGIKDSFNPAAAVGGVVVSSAPAICKSKKNQDQIDQSFEYGVESGALSAAGITLDPIVGTQPKYYAGQEVSLISTLKAKSFDTKISVNTSCQAKPTSSSGVSPLAGKMNPAYFEFNYAENKDIMCKFPSMAAGKSYDVSITADFNYVTSAYVRRYFTKAGLLSQFASSSTKPEDGFYSFYKITDTNPKSISTRGPAVLGLDIVNPVIELYDESTGREKQFTVRMLVKNVGTWNGKLLSVNGVLFSLPKGLEIISGMPRKKPAAITEESSVTWSDLSCTVSGLVGNFRVVDSDECDAAASSKRSVFTNINCRDYNNYLLVPTNESSTKALTVGDGQEKSQQIYFTCDVAATNANAILNNAPYAVKSIRASTAYTYSISQKKSIKIEPGNAANGITYADDILSKSTFCGAEGKYTITPVLDKVFVGETVVPNNPLRRTYDSMIDTISRTIVRDKLTPDNSKLLTADDCSTKSIAQAIILQSWNEVSGNAMIGGSYYGYMKAKKPMLTYISKAPSSFASAAFIPADVLTFSAIDLDTFMRANYLGVSWAYMDALKSNCTTTYADKAGVDEVTCIVGKYLCGETYRLGNTATYCEQKTVPEVVTLATQIAQIQKIVNLDALAIAMAAEVAS